MKLNCAEFYLEIDRNNNEPYLAGGERFLDDPWGNPSSRVRGQAVACRLQWT